MTLAKALSQPLFLLSILMCLCVLGTLKWLPKPRTSRLLAYVLALTAATTAAVSVWNSYRNASMNAVFTSQKPPFSIRVRIFGQTRTETLSPALTYRVSSGSVNVGCDESRDVSVSWNPPQGAVNIAPLASWQNTDNVRLMHADVVPPAPNEPIIARGFIQGLQRSLFGNCLGGGHAELVLTGTYRLPEAHLTEPQLIKTFEDRLADGQPALIGLPNGENLTPTRGTVEIVGGKGSTLVNLSFTVQGDRVSLQQNAVRSDIPVDVQLRQDGLMVVPH